MLPANATLMTTASAIAIKTRATNFNTQNVPALANGELYFAKTDDVVGLEASPLMRLGEFVGSDAELTAAQTRQQGAGVPAPVYDTRSGNRYNWSGSAWVLDATYNLWTDAGVGRFAYNPNTYVMYFIAGLGNVLTV